MGYKRELEPSHSGESDSITGEKRQSQNRRKTLQQKCPDPLATKEFRRISLVIHSLDDHRFRQDTLAREPDDKVLTQNCQNRE